MRVLRSTRRWILRRGGKRERCFSNWKRYLDGGGDVPNRGATSLPLPRKRFSQFGGDFACLAPQKRWSWQGEGFGCWNPAAQPAGCSRQVSRDPVCGHCPPMARCARPCPKSRQLWATGSPVSGRVAPEAPRMSHGRGWHPGAVDEDLWGWTRPALFVISSRWEMMNE